MIMKKVVRFSIRKYRKWCKQNNEPVFPWADDCDKQIVTDWNGTTGNCNGYIVYRNWVVIRYE